MHALIRKLFYYWRVLATGIAFTTFGIGGITLPVFALVFFRFIPGSKQQQQSRARLLVHYTFKAFIYFMRFLGILRWKIDGLEKLQRSGLLILANHPTLLDVVFLVAFIPNATCIVKSHLLRNPAMRGFVTLTGYITNDKGEKLIQSARESFHQSSSLIIFPEGTRTQANNPRPFQRGAANIAIRTRTNITPVRIYCNPPTLSKEKNWYQVPEKTFLMSFYAADDISISPFLEDNSSLAARKLTRHLENYFKEEEYPDGCGSTTT